MDLVQSNNFKGKTSVKLEERLRLLNDRLLGWLLCGQLEDVFSAAIRRYDRDGSEILIKADEAEEMYPVIHAAPFDLLLSCFEESLEDVDKLIEVTNGMDDCIGENE